MCTDWSGPGGLAEGLLSSGHWVRWGGGFQLLPCAALNSATAGRGGPFLGPSAMAQPMPGLVAGAGGGRGRSSALLESAHQVRIEINTTKGCLNDQWLSDGNRRKELYEGFGDEKV